MATMDETLAGLSILMARQPIYTRSCDVFAFELLAQDDEGQFIEEIKDSKATLAVLMGTYASAFQDGNVQTFPFFIRVTETFLMDHEMPDIPRHNFVIVIMGIPSGTSGFFNRVQELTQKGYRIAFGHYDPSNPIFEPFLHIVDLVKVDIQRVGIGNIRTLTTKLRSLNVEVIAEKIETREEFEMCVEAGCDLFMGYFLSRPELIRGKKLSTNKTVLLQLLSELQEVTATAETVQDIALNDPKLTFKIMKLVNSAIYSLRREITSLSHAISLLGMCQIKRWVVLFLTQSEDSGTTELTRQMLQRGRMCELIAEITGAEPVMDYFIVGLFSQLDVALNIDMKDLMEQIPITTEMKNGLLSRDGNYGLILKEVEFYERAEFDQLLLLKDRHYYEAAYRHAITWSNEVIAIINE